MALPVPITKTAVPSLPSSPVPAALVPIKFPCTAFARDLVALHANAATVVPGNDVAGSRRGATDGVAGTLTDENPKAAITQVSIARDVGADEVALNAIPAACGDSNPTECKSVDDQTSDRAIAGRDLKTAGAACHAAVDFNLHHRIHGLTDWIGIGQSVVGHARCHGALRESIDDHGLRDHWQCRQRLDAVRSVARNVEANWIGIGNRVAVAIDVRCGVGAVDRLTQRGFPVSDVQRIGDGRHNQATRLQV